MHRWYVVQVLSTHEKKVKKVLEENRESQGLQDLISEILLPVENVLEVKKGEQRVTEKRLWPGYLMVKMELNDKTRSFISEANGVIGFLGGGQPTPLTEEEERAILDDLEHKKEEVTQKHHFNAGDRVKIVDGVFVNFLGTVIEVNYEKGRLSAMVSIFGRETRVDDLEFWQVEEVTDDQEGVTLPEVES